MERLEHIDKIYRERFQKRWSDICEERNKLTSRVQTTTKNLNWDMGIIVGGIMVSGGEILFIPHATSLVAVTLGVTLVGLLTGERNRGKLQDLRMEHNYLIAYSREMPYLTYIEATNLAA